MTNQKDDALIVVDTNVCNGSDLAACATLDPPEIHTGADPEIVTLDPDTQTLYTANQVDNDVSVIDASRCDAQTTTGCRRRVPKRRRLRRRSRPTRPSTPPYVASSATTVAMIDTKSCNAFQLGRVRADAADRDRRHLPAAVAVDPSTHTVYVANAGAGTSGTVSVLDDRTCNATDQSGCATSSTAPRPGREPGRHRGQPAHRHDLRRDHHQQRRAEPDLRLQRRTCNASTSARLRPDARDRAVGDDGDGGSTESVAVNPATNTIYATSNTHSAARSSATAST